MKIIKAKFNSTCGKCGCSIPKGVNCHYAPEKKKVFCMPCGNDIENPVDEDSIFEREKREMENVEAGREYWDNGTDPAAGMIQANEEAYFDNQLDPEERYYSGYTAYQERDSDFGRDY